MKGRSRFGRRHAITEAKMIDGTKKDPRWTDKVAMSQLNICSCSHLEWTISSSSYFVLILSPPGWFPKCLPAKYFGNKPGEILEQISDTRIKKAVLNYWPVFLKQPDIFKKDGKRNDKLSCITSANSLRLTSSLFHPHLITRWQSCPNQVSSFISLVFLS